MPSVKVLTIQMLRQLNDRAIRARANRTINPTALALLSSEKVYPVSTAFLHNDRDMRCRIVVNDQGDVAWLDMTLEDYGRIPTVDFSTEEICYVSNDSNVPLVSPPAVEAISSVPSSLPPSVPARPRRNASGRGAAARPTSPRVHKPTKSK